MYTYMQEQDLLQRKAFASPSPSPESFSHPIAHEPHDHGACACGGGCPKCQGKAAAAQGLSSLLSGGPSIQRTATSPIISDESPASGHPLDRDTRAFMERRFGHDFGDVRVHADSAGNRSADAVGAQAYTSGNQIVFGTGHYSPDTQEGKALLAHELVHSIQQRSSSSTARNTLTFDAHPAEAEARTVSESVMRGRAISPVRTSVPLSSRSVSLQLDPRKVYCALHAAVCLGLSENPPAAALCWTNFATRCAGAMASNGAPGGAGADGTTVATAAPAAGGGEMAGASA